MKMSLALSWTNKIDNVDDIFANDVNLLADAIIENEKNIKEAKTTSETNRTSINRIDDEIENINETLDTQNEKNNEFIKKFSPVIVGRGSGESITIHDASEAPLLGLSVMGKTKQVRTAGAQLLNNTFTDKTNNGITGTKNADGSITFNGTATANATFGIGAVDVVEGQSYYVSGCPIGGSSSTYNLVVQLVKDGSFVTYKRELGDGLILTPDSTYNGLKVFIIIYNGTTATSLTFFPMIIKGETKLPYEPYTGGKPSPSPEYPQSLNTIASDGKITTDIFAKNHFNTDKFVELIKTYDSTATEVVRDGRRCIRFLNQKLHKKNFNDALHFSSDKIYTWSMDVKFDSEQTATSGNFVFGFLYGDEKPETAALTTPPSGIIAYNRLRALAASEAAKFTKFTRTSVNTLPFAGIGFSYGSPAYWLIDLDSIQIEEGDKVTPYEPYKGTSLTLSTPNGLPGVPMHGVIADDADPIEQHRNYVDGNGVSWICDEIDLERGVYIQRVGEYTFNSADAHFMQEDEGLFKSYWIDASDLPFDIKDRSHGLWEMGEFSSYDIMNPTATSTFYVSDLHPVSEVKNGIVDLFLNLPWDNDISDYNDSKFLLVRKEPIEIPLSDEEIEAYKAIQTYKPITHISNDVGAHMKVEYVADTKAYIDNKFAELQKAIIINA